jgi:hypothetical protein
MKRSSQHLDAPLHAARRRLTQLVRTALFAAAALAAMPAAHAAGTVVIDFENAPLGLIGNGDYLMTKAFYVGGLSNSPIGQPGDLVGNLIRGSEVADNCFDMACPSAASNSSKYLMALNDGFVDIVHSNPAQSFGIKSFDASFVGAFAGASYPATSGVLRVQGFLANGNSMYQDFALSGPGANGFEFGHYSTTGAFANTEFVEVAVFGFACGTSGPCQAFQTNRGQFALDNITTTVPVPEPSSWLMMGAGLLALGAAARRRNA